MKKVYIKTDPKFDLVFKSYPAFVRKPMNYLRELIIETAEGMGDIDSIEETLRWGEPSFIVKSGCTLRIDWKEKTPGRYAMYFPCTSRLIETFRVIYGNTFEFEGKRAIIFQIDQKIPELELKDCIKACLHYHKVKDHITLGM